MSANQEDGTREAAVREIGENMNDVRRPRWVYGVGEEPDHRLSLANERTFLAWIRTSLGLIGGGIAIDAFGLASPGVRAVLASALVVLGGLCGGMASVRWARIERALPERGPMPAATMTWVTSAAAIAVRS